VIGSAFPGLEATSSYIIRILDRLQHDNIKNLAVKESAQIEFNQWAQMRMKAMAWTGDCKSWCKCSCLVVFPDPGVLIYCLVSV